MQYALIDEKNRLAGLAELDGPEAWSHPEGMRVVEADGFDYDGMHG